MFRLILLLACARQASGQVNSLFYVSTAGSDSNPGTETAPWRTVQHAADTARAGSTVNVRGGIYEELVSINVSGNVSDGFITFRSYPGETASLDAEHFTPSGRQAVLTIHKQSYVRIEGFEIRNFHTAEHPPCAVGHKRHWVLAHRASEEQRPSPSADFSGPRCPRKWGNGFGIAVYGTDAVIPCFQMSINYPPVVSVPCHLSVCEVQRAETPRAD